MTLRITRLAGGLAGFAIGTLLALAAPLTYAQTGTTTPGAPETGVGGDPALTLAALGISGTVLVVGAIAFARMREG